MRHTASILRLWGSRLVLYLVSVLFLSTVAYLPTGVVNEYAPQTEMEQLMRRPPTVVNTYWSAAQYGGNLADLVQTLRAGHLMVRRQTATSTWGMDEPLLKLIRAAWWNSFILFGAAAVGGILVGLLLGTLVALRSKLLRSLSIGFSVTSLSLPDFLVVIGAQAITLWSSRQFGVSLWPILASPDSLKGWLEPLLVLTLAPAGYTARLTASAFDEIMQADYIRTARGKGVGEGDVIFGHAFRNALPRVISGIPAVLNVTLSGLVVVEWLTNWPGLTKWLVNAPLLAVVVSGSLFIAWFLVLDGLAHTLRLLISPPREEVTA